MRFRDTLVAVLAGTLGAAIVQAAPRPAPAPPGLHEQSLAAKIRDLQRDVQDAERAAWEWRDFQRCVHTQAIRVSLVPNAAVPVTWKTECLEPVR